MLSCALGLQRAGRCYLGRGLGGKTIGPLGCSMDRGCFLEVVKFRAPRELTDPIAAAADAQFLSVAEYTRRALLCALERDGRGQAREAA